jgi:hypothetical protein
MKSVLPVKSVLPESSATGPVGSLEVRWFFPGPFEAAMAGWFARFPFETESRADTYLLNPELRGLSVKVRAGGALDVKVYHGSPGILDMAGRARGRMQIWQKWSFGLSPLGQDDGDPHGWRTVYKRRRVCRFSPHTGRILAAAGLADEPPCVAAELAEGHMRGGSWWSFGFEATGPADRLRAELDAAARLVFAAALPKGVKLGTEESMSYPEWLHLCQRRANHDRLVALRTRMNAALA